MKTRTKIAAALGVVAALSVLSSTPEQRKQARDRLRRYNPVFAALAIGLWALILFY